MDGRCSIPGGDREFYLFATASRPALGPTHSPIQWIPAALFREVKRPGRETDHCPPSGAEVENVWSYTSVPQYVFMAWCLVKHGDNFTFYLYFAEVTTVSHKCSDILVSASFFTLRFCSGNVTRSGIPAWSNTQAYLCIKTLTIYFLMLKLKYSYFSGQCYRRWMFAWVLVITINHHERPLTITTITMVMN
jgi:hypothetical protein